MRLLPALLLLLLAAPAASSAPGHDFLYCAALAEPAVASCMAGSTRRADPACGGTGETYSCRVEYALEVVFAGATRDAASGRPCVRLTVLAPGAWAESPVLCAEAARSARATVAFDVKPGPDGWTGAPKLLVCARTEGAVRQACWLHQDGPVALPPEGGEAPASEPEPRAFCVGAGRVDAMSTALQSCAGSSTGLGEPSRPVRQELYSLP